ncbi:MAG: hypothetical protein V1818_04120, partial [Candidatus Aenigmatarchaeota archaeon]
MKSSTKTGQSQLLIPLIVIITSAIVFATNVTMNMTNSPTGYAIGIPDQTFSFPIEVWANTSIGFEVKGDSIKATLLLDNGSVISDGKLNFYLNETPLYSDYTDKHGRIDFPLPFNGTIRATYAGGEYTNPSENNLDLRLDSSEIETLSDESIKNEKRGSNWIDSCQGDTCSRKIYATDINIKNEEGEYRPFTEVVKMSWNDELLSFNLSWYEGSIEIKPFFVYDNKHYNVQQIMEMQPDINISGELFEREYNWEYGLNILNISPKISDKLDNVGFYIAETRGISIDDIDNYKDKQKIKDKIKIGYQDLIDKNYSYEIVNKTHVLIGKVKNKSELLLDPVVEVDGSTEDVADIWAGDAVANHDDHVQIKWSIDSLYSVAASLVNVTQCFYIGTVNGAGVDSDVRFWRINDQTWTEASITTTIYNGQSALNQTEGTWNSTSISTWTCTNVTNAVINDFNAANTYSTIRFEDVDNAWDGGMSSVTTSSTGLAFGDSNNNVLFVAKEFGSYYPFLIVFFNPKEPIFSEGSVNGTAFVNKAVNHTINIAYPDGYIFSWNGTSDCSGGWSNSSWVDASEDSTTAWNVSIPSSGCAGKAVAWKFYANNSGGWNNSSTYTYDVYKYGTLELSWTDGSQINDTCSSGSLCEFSQYDIFKTNATVTCSGGAGALCGSVSVDIRYNSSSAFPDDVINTTAGATPFHNDEQMDIERLSNGTNYIVNGGLEWGNTSGWYIVTGLVTPTINSNAKYDGSYGIGYNSTTATTTSTASILYWSIIQNSSSGFNPVNVTEDLYFTMFIGDHMFFGTAENYVGLYSVTNVIMGFGDGTVKTVYTTRGSWYPGYGWLGGNPLGSWRRITSKISNYTSIGNNVTNITIELRKGEDTLARYRPSIFYDSIQLFHSNINLQNYADFLINASFNSTTGYNKVENLIDYASSYQNAIATASSSPSSSSTWYDYALPKWSIDDRVNGDADDCSKIDNCLSVPFKKYWRSNNEGSGAWLNINFAQEVTLKKIVLWDAGYAANVGDLQNPNVTSGHINFSDSSSVEFGALPADGSEGLEISFSERSVTSINITIDSCQGNASIAEVDAYGIPTNTIPSYMVSTPETNQTTYIKSGVDSFFEIYDSSGSTLLKNKSFSQIHSGDTYIFTGIQTCGSMTDDQTCLLNWTINATAAGIRALDVNASSAYASVLSNNTTTAYVNITGLSASISDFTDADIYSKFTTEIYGSCSNTGSEISDASIVIQDNRTGSFTDSATTGDIYVNTTNYTIGSLSGTSSDYYFTVTGNLSGNYLFRMKCNATSTADAFSSSKNVTVNAWLNVSWVSGSELNSTCSSGSPCEFNQYSNINTNATVQCVGGDCGTVNGSIRYNESGASPDDLINTIYGATPF